MNLVLAALLLLPVWGISSWAWGLLSNYRAAKTSGLPLVISPFNPNNIIYMILKVPLRSTIEKLVPLPGVKLSIFGWEFLYKYTPHEQHGKSFILVTPGQNELWCSDPAMARVILTRRKDFVAPPIVSKIMGFQGDNVISSTGDNWARQRRLVAPNLNERVSEMVWRETTSQSRQMADYMLLQGDSDETDESLRAITVNVLGQVAYGQRPKAFEPIKLPTDPDSEFSYTDAVFVCSQYIILAALLPTSLLSLPIMPKSIQTLAAAVRKLPGLTKKMLQQERVRQAASSEPSDNLMSMLVRLSDSGKSEKASEKGLYLTESEIAGNMFLFTLAGFDTTAASLAYGITMLAAHAKWQAWVQEEIDHVLGASKPEIDETPDYATIYPKLTRCLAVLFETLRLFPPITHLIRGIETSQTITTSEGSHTILGPCKVFINSTSLQMWPGTWGEDSLVFRPTRWIAETLDSGLGNEQLLSPGRGTFLPWSDGPRVCPGMKMAQVEFVAVLATFFRKCRIEPVVKPGETMEEAQQRLVDITQDSMSKMTLQMKRPKEVHLKWSKR